MIIHTCDQRSDEWHKLRLGRLTGSRAKDMMATIKSGEAAARRNLRTALVCERLTGQPADDPFTSPDMLRGIELEPAARRAYEHYTDTRVTEFGFIHHDTLLTGYSPDGVVGPVSADSEGVHIEGIIEIKCPKPANHLRYYFGKEVPSDYFYQCLHGLWLTGAQWLDFISYSPNFPGKAGLFITRMWRKDNESFIKSYALAVSLFLSEVDKEEAEVRALAEQ